MSTGICHWMRSWFNSIHLTFSHPTSLQCMLMLFHPTFPSTDLYVVHKKWV
jgi:hypothetical protein